MIEKPEAWDSYTWSVRLGAFDFWISVERDSWLGRWLERRGF